MTIDQAAPAPMRSQLGRSATPTKGTWGEKARLPSTRVTDPLSVARRGLRPRLRRRGVRRLGCCRRGSQARWEWAPSLPQLGGVCDPDGGVAR
jgi:hypothetical protein